MPGLTLPTDAVRRVTVADAARVRALRLEMLADAPLAYLEPVAQAAARPHAEFRRRIAEVATGDQRAQFIADIGGRLVGNIGGLAAHDDPRVTVLFAIYVTPAHRRTGVLERLVEAVAAWSRAAGRDELRLEVVVGNTRAVKAYQRLGFADTGQRKPHPTITGLTELVMTRPAAGPRARSARAAGLDGAEPARHERRVGE